MSKKWKTMASVTMLGVVVLTACQPIPQAQEVNQHQEVVSKDTMNESL